MRRGPGPGTPRNRLGRTAGVAPTQGVGGDTKVRSLEVGQILMGITTYLKVALSGMVTSAELLESARSSLTMS